MIKTLIFGAVAGYFGKKLYDDGKLDDAKATLKRKLNLSGSSPAYGADAYGTPGSAKTPTA